MHTQTFIKQAVCNPGINNCVYSPSGEIYNSLYRPTWNEGINCHSTWDMMGRRLSTWARNATWRYSFWPRNVYD